MARLRKGEKLYNESRLWRLLYRSVFGLRETAIAAELGWERRTVNNYLRALEAQGRAYKEGRVWLADR